MIIGIDPKVDYAFKYLYGRDVTRPILIDVVNSVLQPSSGAAIGELELLNPFNPKETLDDKLSILDIKARDQSGQQFNIEMQMSTYPAYDKRILFYASRLHQQQLHQGVDYSELRPTISISFLNHVLFPQVPEHHLRFSLLERLHHFPFNTDLAFHILELPKFTKTAAELKNGLDIWLYFLRHAEKMNSDSLPAALARPPVKRALEELKMLTQMEIEREQYEARLKAQLDHNSLMKAAQRFQEQGLKEGREAGRQQGEKIGVIKFCERMLNRPNTPAEQLATLSLEELTRLAEELQNEVLNQRAGN